MWKNSRERANADAVECNRVEIVDFVELAHFFLAPLHGLVTGVVVFRLGQHLGEVATELTRQRSELFFDRSVHACAVVKNIKEASISCIRLYK